jgi:hypothetical protein
MSKKIMVLALVAVSAAMLALPAFASAGVWDIRFADGTAPTVANPITYTFESPVGETQKLTSAIGTISCTKVTGAGNYTTETTGSITAMDFTGCKDPFGGNCTTEGAAVGTIAPTLPMVTHNIRLEPGETTALKHEIGVLITPAGTTPATRHYATFSCTFTGKVLVEGTGVIGQVTTPTCGTKTKESTLTFEGTGNTQKWRQITTTGTVYDLHSSIFGGSPGTAAQDGKAVSKFAKEITSVCT